MPSSPAAQTSAAPLPQSAFRRACVGDATAVQAWPSQCISAPCVPAAQTSSAVAAQTPRRCSPLGSGFSHRQVPWMLGMPSFRGAPPSVAGAGPPSRLGAPGEPASGAGPLPASGASQAPASPSVAGAGGVRDCCAGTADPRTQAASTNRSTNSRMGARCLSSSADGTLHSTACSIVDGHRWW